MSNNKFSGHVQPVRCPICKKLSTAPGIRGGDSRLCGKCWDTAGIENEHQDGYHNDNPGKVNDCPLCRPDLFPNWPR